MESETKACPYCAETINIKAIKCKHCGELLDEQKRVQRVKESQPKQKKYSPGVAALLSFLIPGVGQFYKGKPLAGMFYLIFSILGYALFIVPGVIIHLISIIAAAAGDPYK